MDDFNAAPIMLQHPSSLGGNDKIYDQPSSFCDMDDDVAVDTLVVPQNLAPEQFQYEFPPKSRLKALAHLYDDDDCSFFDEQSFTTASTTSTAAYSTITDEEWSAINHSQYDVNDHLDRFLDSVSEAFSPAAALVDDGKLSPLQLPVQAASDNSNEYRAREQSCDSTSTVTAVVRNKNQGVCPSTFLDDARHAQAEKKDDLVDRRFHDMPIIRSESELSDDNDSDCTSDSKVVFVRLSKRVAVDGTRRCVSSRLWTGSDEGYDEALDDDKELPIESSSVFLPVSEEIDQHDLCTAAAIKIQAAWRGYRTRKHLTAHKAAASMVRVCGAVHRRQITRLQERLDALERRLAEETAMRMAFEKAMEDMTILVDQQQNMLYDRIEQETKMRQIQERKANEALAHMERRLQKEVRAREELQATTMQILDELKELKAASRRQQRQLQQDEKTTAKTHHHRLFAQQQNLDATMKRGSPATITATTLRRTGATSAGRASPATRTDIINIKRSALRPASRTTRTPISTV